MFASEFDTNHLLNSLNSALVMVNEKLQIVYTNHAGEALFETGFKQLYGHQLAEFFIPNSINNVRLKAALRRGEDFTENDLRLCFKDGRNILSDLTVTNLNTEDGPKLMFEVRRIDQQRRISRENQQNAQHDAAESLSAG